MAKRSRSEEEFPISPSETSPNTLPTPSSMEPTSPQPRGKSVQLEDEDAPEVMRCSLPPHREVLSFSSYEDYEVHYMQAHVNRCSECQKNFPTGHLLSLHIEENHDPLIEARRARGEKTFGCFVEGCDRKCSTTIKRRRHLIDKHSFPKTYNFFIVNHGIDKRTSMLKSGPQTPHKRRVSTTSSPQHEGRLRRRQLSLSMSGQTQSTDNATQPDKTGGDISKSEDVDDLAKSMSALKFVPTSVTMRRNRG